MASTCQLFIIYSKSKTPALRGSGMIGSAVSISRGGLEYWNNGFWGMSYFFKINGAKDKL